jgi:hypothetical protein
MYSVTKLYMFRHLFCPSSGVLYCTFGTSKFHAGFDDRFQAESGWNRNAWERESFRMEMQTFGATSMGSDELKAHKRVTNYC